MLLAHGPSGYLLARLLSPVFLKGITEPPKRDRLYRSLLVAGVVGGIFPDFDFIYHLFIDSARTPHHSYLTHIPFFWLATWLFLAGIGMALRNRDFAAVVTMFSLGAMLHLTLDTFTGVIYWFSPLSRKGINIFRVADVHLYWVENFTRHWTFFFEIVIVAAAMAIFLRVKETVTDIVHAFRHYGKLRALSLRLAVCAAGAGVLVLVASMKFDIDNRAFAKAVKMKQHVAGMLKR